MSRGVPSLDAVCSTALVALAFAAACSGVSAPAQVVAAPQPRKVAVAAPEAVAIANAEPAAPPAPMEPRRVAEGSYEPSVRLGNQLSLNAARVPFAAYINMMHNRLHPIFAEELLS